MNHNYGSTGPSAAMVSRVDQMEKRLDALVRQLELSGALDEASSGVRIALMKAGRTEQP